MAITYGDHLIDIGHRDITPEQEREIEAREECARRGIDPDELCADGGVEAWMVVDQERNGRTENRLPRCPDCGAPAGMDCRTVQGRIPPHASRIDLIKDIEDEPF